MIRIQDFERKYIRIGIYSQEIITVYEQIESCNLDRFQCDLASRIDRSLVGDKTQSIVEITNQFNHDTTDITYTYSCRSFKLFQSQRDRFQRGLASTIKRSLVCDEIPTIVEILNQFNHDDTTDITYWLE